MLARQAGPPTCLRIWDGSDGASQEIYTPMRERGGGRGMERCSVPVASVYYLSALLAQVRPAQVQAFLRSFLTDRLFSNT